VPARFVMILFVHVTNVALRLMFASRFHVAKARAKDTSAIAVGTNFTRERVRMENKMENYLGPLDELKEKIAKMCVDMTGSMVNKRVMVRVNRGGSFSLEYYQYVHDGYYDSKRFLYGFPVYFYRDMPSGHLVRETKNGNYYLVDENEKFVQKIDKNDLKNDLIDDMVKSNFNGFNQHWESFLNYFQKWIDAEEME